MQSNILKGKFCPNPISMRRPCIWKRQWECPPKVILDSTWLVAAGEESKEAVSQRHDETDPRLSASLYMASDNDDSSVPAIPLSPIEIEEGEIVEDDTSAASTITPSMKLENQNKVITCSVPVTPNIISDDMLSLARAGAAAALTAYALPRVDPNLIDMDLRIQLLHNVDAISKLLRGQGVPPTTGIESLSPAVSFPLPQTEGSEFPMADVQPTRSLPLSQVHRPPVMGEGPLVPLTGTKITAADPYARSDLLIDNVGGTREAVGPDVLSHGNTQFVGQGPSSSASRLKAPKLCIYFRSSVGCRNGTSCPYLHIKSDQPAPSRAEPLLPRVKRMKLDWKRVE